MKSKHTSVKVKVLWSSVPTWGGGEGLPHTNNLTPKTNSPNTSWMSSIQVNSDTIYPQVPTRLLPPHPPPTTDVGGKSRPLPLLLTNWLQIRGSNGPVAGFA